MWVWNIKAQQNSSGTENPRCADGYFKKGMARARLEIFPNGMHERHRIRKVNCPAPGIG